MALKIHLHIGRMEHHRRWCGAFLDGLTRHGLQVKILPPDQPEKCDLAVFWAHRQQRVIEFQKAQGNDYLVLENAYLGARTTQWASAGYNGLNGNAEFHCDDVDSTRWAKYFSGLLQPWKTGGQYLLIMGQVPGDQSIKHINIIEWVKQIADECRRRRHEALFRPHPLAAAAGAPPGIPLSSGPLTPALRGAAGVITYNSNSGVDAILAGVPAMVADRGGMAWPVASHTLADPFIRPGRRRWAEKLAWCQWQEKEFRNGEAWEHLRKRYD